MDNDAEDAVVEIEDSDHDDASPADAMSCNSPGQESLPKTSSDLDSISQLSLSDENSFVNRPSWSPFGENSVTYPAQPYVTSSTLSEKEVRKDAVLISPEYATDVYMYMRERERQFHPKAHYLSKQSDVSEIMRVVLVDWLSEVMEEYNLGGETLFLAVSFVDRFLSVMAVPRTKLQLLGVAALYVASKYEEVYPPTAQKFVYITDHTYTLRQLLKMETLLLDNIGFNVSTPTINSFLDYYLKIVRADARTKFTAQYLGEMCLLHAKFLCYYPSLVAAAITCFANVITGGVPWSESIENLSGYGVSDFHQCLTEIHKQYEEMPNCTQQAIREKYSSKRYLNVALQSVPPELPPPTSPESAPE
jgi:cyclin A